MKKFELGPKDKARASHGYGYAFEHTNPQRRVPCIVGDMLAPASADDIPPIPESAAYSIRRAFELLAQLVGDRDHNLYLGDADHDGKATREAEAITRACGGVLAILRVHPVEQPSQTKVVYPAACKDCNDRGTIETGNNDFPCECPAGDYALFNTERGRETGAQIKARRR